MVKSAKVVLRALGNLVTVVVIILATAPPGG
jgi:hypothetical protein